MSFLVMNRLIVFAIMFVFGLFGLSAGDADHLRAKAKKGDIESMVELAEAHYWGRGAELDWKQSFVWAEKASEANHPIASYRMGVQYLLSHGVEEDIGLGQQLINLSANGMEKRAKEGDHRAQFYVAIMYHNGIGRIRNLATARQWMTLAAEGGWADAGFYMGRMYAVGAGAGVKRDFEEAKRWWRMAAEHGHVPSQFNLGSVMLQSKNEEEHPEGMKLLKQAVVRKLDRAELFMAEAALRGFGMPKDDAVAFEYYKKSANQGHMQGQYMTGQALAKGVGIKTDPVEAIVWLTLAARAGHVGATESKRNLGATLSADELLKVRLRSGKFRAEPSLATRKSRVGLMAADVTFLASLSIEELKKHAAAGDKIAKVELAKLYFGGMAVGGQIILGKDVKKSLKLTIELAEAGNEESQWNLGYFYLKGAYKQLEDGTKEVLLKQDFAEAAKWLQKAAEQNYPSAMLILGDLYEKGKGVPKDYKKAMQWFEKAAALGDGQACLAIGEAYFEGRGKVVPMDRVKGVDWFRRGADRGAPQAQYKLGRVYLDGEGAKKDLNAARKWMLRAAWQNHPRAQLNLGRMLRNGHGGPKDIVRAAMWINLAVNNSVFEAVEDFNAIGEQLSREEKIRARELVRKYVPKMEHREVINASDNLAKIETAANKGEKDAQYQLGLRYLNGTGVKLDRVQTCKWLKLAGLQGHALAIKEYEDLILKMTNEEIEAADRAVDEFKAKQ